MKSSKRQKFSVKGKYLKDFPILLDEFDCEKNKLTKEQAGKIKAGSNKPYHWKCLKTLCEFKCEHSWKVCVAKRTALDRGCPFCTKKKCCKHNSVGSLYPNLYAEFDQSLNPKIDIFKTPPGSKTRINWKCPKVNCELKCAHIWSTTPLHRSSGQNCPFCSPSRPIICEHNSIAVKCPELMLEWSDKNHYDPKKLNLFSGKKCIWICRTCNYEWEAPVCARNYGSKGCLCSPRISKGEAKVITILNKLSEKNLPFQFTFKSQKTFADLYNEEKTKPLRYDFVIYSPDLKLIALIEWDGKQHFSPSPLFNNGKDPFDAWIHQVKTDLNSVPTKQDQIKSI